MTKVVNIDQHRGPKSKSEYEKRFDDLVAGSLQGIMVTRNQSIVFANQALSNILGYSIEELTALETWEALVARDDRERVLTYCKAREKEDAAPARYEYQAVRKDGTVIWLENLSRRVRWDGELMTQATVIDITERRLAEKRLREMSRKSQEFASSVAHELQTPLSYIIGRLQILEASGDLEDLHEATGRMSRLVNQFLTLALLEKLDLGAGETVDLRDICVQAANLFRAPGETEPTIVEVVGDEGPVIVRGDRDCLTTAVTGLVDNARKYSESSDVISLRVGAEGTISVIDRGKGVPFEKRKEIFQRLDGEMDSMTGTGLGLYIVSQIMEAHGGTVKVTDTPGSGATFILDLTGGRK